MVIIKDFDAPRNCVNCQNEGLSEIVGCGLFDEWGKHPDCPFIEVEKGACTTEVLLLLGVALADDTTEREV